MQSLGFDLKKHTPQPYLLNTNVCLKEESEERKNEQRLTPLAASPERCEPRPLHLYLACTSSSWSPGSSEGSLCTPPPAPATGLGVKCRRVKVAGSTHIKKKG